MPITAVDLEAEFVQSVLDALHRDRKLSEVVALAYGKCASTANVIDLIFPLLTRTVQIDYILMLSIENNPHVLLQFLRLIEARLVQNDSWTVLSVGASLRSVASALHVDWEHAQRLLKCCILFADSPLPIIASIVCLGKHETSVRLRSAAQNIELSHLIN